MHYSQITPRSNLASCTQHAATNMHHIQANTNVNVQKYQQSYSQSSKYQNCVHITLAPYDYSEYE